MTLEVDPEVLAGITPVLAQMHDGPPMAVDDWQVRRTRIGGLLARLAAEVPPLPGITSTRFDDIPAGDGTISITRFARGGEQRGSAVVYFHGGGLILGDVATYAPLLASHASRTGVPFFGVEYRLAPEHPDLGPVEDCYAGLTWLHEQAPNLGIDRARIAVMGDSAGGGLAAGVALMARDRGGPSLAAQLLVYPMLDDRTRVDDVVDPLTWTYDDNATAWDALLGARVGGADVSPYVAPARATSLAGLPPALVDVGQLDVFRREDVAYAQRLADAGVPVELHVRPGCPHAFDGFAPDAAVSRRAVADRLRIVAAL